MKPTHECNLACKYCYVEANAKQGRMSERTLQSTIEEVAKLVKESIHFIWHGGEPLLMGLDFYRQAVDIQGTYFSDKDIKNSMQSNVTLVDEEVLDFCERYEFSIGSSMDGPEEIHNLTRVYSDGRGSFQDVWRGLQLIRQRNEKLRESARKKKKRPKSLGSGIITILTRKNIDRIDEIYDFFKIHRIPIKINPLIKSGKATDNYKELGIEPAEYGKVLIKLFNRWFYEKEQGIDVDPLSSILGNLMTAKPVGCEFRESCRDGFISIGPNGDIYPCGRFDGVKEYWLGNINADRLTDVLESKKHKALATRGSETVKDCSTCKYKRMCNAGCMHNAYMQRGEISDKDYYCASYKMLFRHLEKALDRELDRVEVIPEEVEKYRVAMKVKQEIKGGEGK